MIPLTASERLQLSRKLVSVKQEVAEAITSEFFDAHPDWLARYGERGRRICTEDAGFHIAFLAGALEAGSPQAFADYARWTVRVLAARGIGYHSLEENFNQLEKRLSAVLLPAEHSAVSYFLDMGRKACSETPRPAATPAADTRLGLVRDAFLDAILGGRRQTALAIAEEALRDGHSHIDIYIDVFSEALRAVGAQWEANKISVAQEHMATAITQYAIAMIYPRMVPAVPLRGSMVVTGVAGEQHQIGANLVADAMEAHGWAVRFLGTNLPHSTVLSTIEEASADVLCISTTLVAKPSLRGGVDSPGARALGRERTQDCGGRRGISPCPRIRSGDRLRGHQRFAPGAGNALMPRRVPCP